ncbi:MAG: OsmC family peroxiredoxin [Desulfovibrio sp.]|nr:OsmC family peroxiredoxin [Desulfovibrio sp.]
MAQEAAVRLVRKGPVIDLDLESRALGRIHVDIDSVPEDERPGAAKKLLGASVLYCYVAALDKALEARGARYDSIDASAQVRAGSNDKGQGRILGIALNVIVRMDSAYEEVFDRVAKVMRHGCLVSASLEAAFPVTYNLELECTDE